MAKEAPDPTVQVLVVRIAPEMVESQTDRLELPLPDAVENFDWQGDVDRAADEPTMLSLTERTDQFSGTTVTYLLATPATTADQPVRLRPAENQDPEVDYTLTLPAEQMEEGYLEPMAVGDEVTLELDFAADELRMYRPDQLEHHS